MLVSERAWKFYRQHFAIPEIRAGGGFHLFVSGGVFRTKNERPKAWASKKDQDSQSKAVLVFVVHNTTGMSCWYLVNGLYELYITHIPI